GGRGRDGRGVGAAVGGICGAVERRRPVDAETLQRMAARIRHRGPDEDGFFASAADRSPSAGFGFRRLAIIDLQTGNQPMTNEDETVRLVFNGEIYNYRELRRDPQGPGPELPPRSGTGGIVSPHGDTG